MSSAGDFYGVLKKYSHDQNGTFSDHASRAQGLFGHTIGNGQYGADFGLQGGNVSFGQQFRGNIERLFGHSGFIDGIPWNNGTLLTSSGWLPKDFTTWPLHTVNAQGITTQLATIANRELNLIRREMPPSLRAPLPNILRPLRAGDRFESYGSKLFHGGSSQFRDEAAVRDNLVNVVNSLNGDPDLNIVIYGVSNQSWDKFAVEASDGRTLHDIIKDRAGAVRQILEGQGISPSRIKIGPTEVFRRWI